MRAAKTMHTFASFSHHLTLLIPQTSRHNNTSLLLSWITTTTTTPLNLLTTIIYFFSSSLPSLYRINHPMHAMIILSKKKKKTMGFCCSYYCCGCNWKELALLSLLFLILFQMEATTSSCYALDHDQNVKVVVVGSSSSSSVPGPAGIMKMNNAVKTHRGSSRSRISAADNNKDEIFGSDKRKVYTGPNPLHNR